MSTEEILFKPSDYIALGASLIALLAVIVGPLISLRIARRQTISPMRQKWINVLRSKIVEYVTELRTAILPLEGQYPLADKEVIVFYKRVVSIRIEIELMLNPEEEDHNKLISLMKDSIEENETKGKIINKKKLRELLDDTKKVLKSEWKVVKIGK